MSGASHLEREIREQGRVLAERTEPGWRAAGRAAEILRRSDVEFVVVAARGTSDNAARYAQYLLGMDARLAAGLAAPFLYAGESAPLLSRAAVLAISQSGRSPDITNVVAAGRSQGRPTIAITNDVGSPLAAAADVVVPLLAGREQSVAATKTYLASLHAIAQIATCVVPGLDRQAGFDRLPAIVSEAAEAQLAAREQFDRLGRMTVVTVVGRGLHLATAYETALKIRELSGVVTEAFSLPDLLHGPIAALHPSGAMWLVATAGGSQPGVHEFEPLRQAVGLSVVVSDDPDLVAAADLGVRLSPLPEWAAPIVAVIPGQAAALRLAEMRGIDPDRPPGLSKVTLTR
jgi:glucosamine--fructose-6-phosphate aminotransferase (isomerizing)